MNTTATVQSTNAIWILTLPVSPPYEMIKIVSSGPSLCVKHDGLGVLWCGIVPGWDLLHLTAEIKDGVLTIMLAPEREMVHMIKYDRITACPGRFVFEQKGLGQIAFEAYVQARKGRSFHGTELPAWDELGMDQRGAWEQFATKNTVSAGYWAYANAMAWQTQMQTAIRSWSEVPSVIQRGWEQAMAAVQSKIGFKGPSLSEPNRTKIEQDQFRSEYEGSWTPPARS